MELRNNRKRGIIQLMRERDREGSRDVGKERKASRPSPRSGMEKGSLCIYGVLYTSASNAAEKKKKWKKHEKSTRSPTIHNVLDSPSNAVCSPMQYPFPMHAVIPLPIYISSPRKNNREKPLAYHPPLSPPSVFTVSFSPSSFPLPLKKP